MYTVKKTFEISASHSLCLDYISPCTQVHGHNWIITVHAKSKELDGNGMVIDFSYIKKKIHSVLDHKNLNDALPFNPTAENIARWCVEQVPNAFRCDVQESEGNIVTYEKI